MILYFKEKYLKAFLRNAIGYSYPSMLFCNSTTVIVCSDAKENIKRSLVMFGLIKTGALVNACLTRSKAYLSLTFHLIFVSFLSMFVIFLSHSTRFGINTLKKFIFSNKRLKFLFGS